MAASPTGFKSRPDIGYSSASPMAGAQWEMNQALIWIKLWHGAESLEIGPISGPDKDKIGLFPMVAQMEMGHWRPGDSLHFHLNKSYHATVSHMLSLIHISEPTRPKR